MLSIILVVFLLVVIIGALPRWPHSRTWGYFPGGVLGTILLVVLFLAIWGGI
jgi:hypothetical protein